MRTLYFCPVVSSIFFYLLFPSPMLSRCRLDVCHTSIQWTGLNANLGRRSETLKRAARGSLQIQDAKIAKKSPSAHHRTTLSGYILAIKAHIDNQKKTVKQQYLPHMSLQYGELRPLAAEIDSGVWAPQIISTGFASWQRYCTTL